MSEKMYAYLLRLFPSAFRKQYQDEALQLYRDRLRDEKGFLGRLRLSLDLITDIARALPLAYRNSYSEVATAAPLPARSDRVPSFQTLQQEPLQRGAMASASVLGVTAFATFTFVIGRPAPYFSEPQHGPISPIQSVIERLNQPISPDSVDNNGGSYAPTQASSDTRQSEASPSSAAVLSSGTSLRAATKITPASRTQEQNPDAGKPNLALPLLSSSSLAQGQSEPIREAEPSATSSYASPRSSTAAASNLSGRWSLSFGAAEEGANAPEWFIFKQDSGELTGIGGLNSTQRYPIIHGLVADNSVSFELDIGKRRFLYNLRLEDEMLRGTLSVSGTNEMRSTSVWLKHVQ